MATTMMDFNNNPNVGLFGFATNNYILVGKEISDETVKEIKRIFELPVHKINIAGTSLIGVFIAGNDDVILVPGITFESELEELDKLKIKYKVLKTDLTCLGNNIIVSESGVLVNENFSTSDIKIIKEVFGLPVEKMSIANTEIPGACIVTNRDKALIHRDTSSYEIKFIEKVLKVKTIPGTVNLGVPYVRSGILCNKKSMIIGESSGPAEIMNAEEALGFIEG
ncbi:translation initiation factor IF-6 [archaeon]|nr:translation initiation factor IF-6 [archaeon]MBL7057315.1 translation initiation factor IF-6 [Candidatus Woesearchaeota archaeon]